MHDSSLGRIVGVLVAPEATFRSIAARPTWLVVWLVILAISLGVGWLAYTKTDIREITEESLERQGRDFTPEQIEQVVAFQEKAGPYFALGGILVGMAVLFLIAAIYWGGLHLLGSEVSYRKTLSTYLYASVPYFVIGAGVLTFLVLLGRDQLTFEEVTTRSFLASNLAAFAPEDTSLVLRSVLAAFDFFALWTCVLLVMGLRRVAAVSTTAATGLVAILFLLGVALRAGFAALGGAGG